MIAYKINPNGTFGGAETFPDSPVLPKGYTFTPPPAIPEGSYAVMNGGWRIINGIEPIYPSAETQCSEFVTANKSRAEALLYETDWTTIPDVTDPAKSNPYLANGDAFVNYRNQVRQIALNPLPNPMTFPEKPQEQWVTVPTDTPPA